jgi:hypothetical protein
MIASTAVFCFDTQEYSLSIDNATRKGSTMKARTLVLAALSFSALTAFADDADPSGQFAASVANQGATRAQVQAQVTAPRTGVSPWSTSYNPLAAFRSERTRAEVTADYLASRNAVAAFTGEDSGSNYLAARRTTDATRQLAGQPVNAQ